MPIKVRTFFQARKNFLTKLEIITAVTTTSDNRFIVSCSFDKSIKIFDFHTREQVHHFQNVHESTFISQQYLIFQDSINRLTVTPDNKYIISGSRDGSIKVFDFEARREVHHFQEAHESKFSCNLDLFSLI